ncbi:hypothetical protein D9615_007609 [Tricholomella constricta]|uniref:HNH nuclease domain-containing protein n=1 Tax=Tricholomella constricta TaxID=117010 RepID=A0A8H5M1R7_9AGAR|nr:hypothetical protein D9615_007609 [Tricholomella constricta]
MFTGMVVENFSYVFQTSAGGAKSITREQMRSFKKVWAEFTNPRTGYLGHRFVPFFAKLSGVFEVKIYPTDHSIPNILAVCKKSSELWSSRIGAGVDMGKLEAVLSGLDYTAIRKRRAVYSRLYHEASISDQQGRGISLNGMLILLAHHKVIVDGEALILKDLISRTETNKLVTDLVNLDRSAAMTSSDLFSLSPLSSLSSVDTQPADANADQALQEPPRKKLRSVRSRRETRSTAKGKEREMPPPAPPVVSTLSAPTVTSNLFRLPPRIIPDARGPSSTLDFITLRHPGNGNRFLALPAYDPLPGAELQFGLHFETVVTACKILAYNRPGYLSESRNRNADRVNLSPNSILPVKSYFYHLDEEFKPGELYPICYDFKNWGFPHAAMPSSWSVPPSTDTTGWPFSQTSLSQKIKDRDKACLISGYTEYLTTAHVVNKEDNKWLIDNQMEYYLKWQPMHHQSPRNLFCLRYDLHLGGFNEGQFVIVPKCDKLVVHFLRPSTQSAKDYHNVVFNHRGNLSHEALYARFAWALMKIVKESEVFKSRTDTDGNDSQDPKPGVSEEGQGDGGERRGDTSKQHKRKHKDGDSEEEDDDDSGTYHPSFSHKSRDALTLEPNSWLSDVLLKMAPCDSQSALEADTCEIEADLKAAARDLPFFVDPTIKPTAYNYENVVWYPGMGVVERRKQAYLDRHPNIRAHSELLQSNSVGTGNAKSSKSGQETSG